MKQFKNRIVGHGFVKASELKKNPGNWRLHPEPQREALKGLIDEVGWTYSVTVNKRTGRIVDGHLRADIAADTKIPVAYVDLSPAEEKLVLAASDSIGAMALTDDAQLAKLLAEIEVGDNPQLNGLLDQLLSEAHLETPQELIEEVDRVAGESKSVPRQMGSRHAQIKPVLYAAQVNVFEQALRKTGEMNRGKALIIVCQEYLDRKRG